MHLRYLPPILLLFSIGLAITLSGCVWNNNNRSSVLVIAVEKLGFDAISCGKESTLSDGVGFNTFCEESVRFTHAYSPSLMSQATLTSILTAKYPLEHNVTHNGNNFLSPKIPTVALSALKLGYRTSFFSGGPPIWSKSGLNRGFETFYDHYQVSLNTYFKPALDNIKTFLNWMDSESYKKPFFSFIFLPDLQFPNQTTRNNNGEIREKSFVGQKAEVSESINYLIEQLKKRNRWDRSYVVLVGLNGNLSEVDSNDLPPLKVASSTSRVSLYIKPPRKKRDLPIHWKIDSNVSLVDLGVSLFDFIGANVPVSKDSNLEVTSLSSVLSTPDVNWNEDRLIPLESGWSKWRELAEPRYAIRKGNYTITLGKSIQVYNNLTDRYERIPINKTDPLWKELSEEAGAFILSHKLPSWIPPDKLAIEKLQLAKKVFLPEVEGHWVSKILKLSHQLYWDDQLKGWAARLLLNSKKYKLLDKYGRKNHKPLWRFVARRNLGKPVKAPKTGCGKFFSVHQMNFKRPQPKECDDNLFIRLLAWTLAKTQPQRDKAFESFWREYKINLREKLVSIENYKLNLNWDVPLDKVGEPSLVELYLSLPKNKPFKKTLKARIANHIDQGQIY